MPKTQDQIRLEQAHRGSQLAIARVQGMKIRAEFESPFGDRPTQIDLSQRFPYPARTCAEWEELPTRQMVDWEMSMAERRRDAKRGSARLKEAIRKAAA